MSGIRTGLQREVDITFGRLGMVVKLQLNFIPFKDAGRLVGIYHDQKSARKIRILCD